MNTHLNELKDVKKKFASDKTKYLDERETLESEFYASNSELIRRNEIVVRLLTKVAEIVDQYKEMVIIQKLLGECTPYIHLHVVTEHIKAARVKLRHAQRAKTWGKSKKKSKFLTPGVQERNVDGFNDHINAAVLELNRDTAKRRGTYFHTLKNTVFDDLPVDLPASKKFTVKEAPVLVFLHAGAKIHGKDCENVQDNLYLIKNARLLGVNRRIKTKWEEVERKAIEKGKCSVFPRSIPKAGSRIDWYLLLDFNAEITNVSFVSSMQLPGQVIDRSDMEGMTLEHYAWVAKKQQEQRSKVATRIQRELRETFEKEEKNNFELLRYLKGMLEIYVEAEEHWKKTFGELTSTDGSAENGLTIDKYSQVNDFFEEYMAHRLSEYDATNETRLAVLNERVGARYAYYCYLMSRRKASSLRAQIKVTRREIEERRAQMAEQFGSVSRMVDEDIRKDPKQLEVM